MFPKHRDKDFVEHHSLGFKNRKNVDLFKHYFRLYVKNKFTIKKGKKDYLVFK